MNPDDQHNHVVTLSLN